MNNNLYIVWGEKNNIGIPIIDEQHRGLISTINSLYSYIHIGLGDQNINSILNILEHYTDVHFKTEEALMRKASYPALKDHIALHKELRDKTEKYSISADLHEDSILLLKFLKEWWLDHINKEDRKYEPFVKKLIEIKNNS